MKAVAVVPGIADSVHLREVPRPPLDEVPDGRGVLVRVLQVGVDGTDREINAALYGAPPDGSDYLIVGHEGFGQVEAVGSGVTEFRAGDFVVATVRRPGNSLYDVIGTSDMTTDSVYFERGINLRHGYLAEYYVEHADFVVKVPPALADVGVLLEPLTVAEKGITQAFEIQRRLRVWRPRRAAVMGAGTIGLLAALLLRLRGLEVCVFGRRAAPYRNSVLLEQIGARYDTSDAVSAGARDTGGQFDLIFEATGSSPVVFESMQLLARNGVLVLSSVTGGDRRVEVPADRINLEFVLGNKVMVGTVNANREYFDRGVCDMALAEAQYRGWLRQLLTDPVEGLDQYRQLFARLAAPGDAIKIFCRVARPLAVTEARVPETSMAV